MIVPFARQWMIDISARQWSVGGEEADDLHQHRIQFLAVPPGFFAPVVTLKAVGVFNFPLSDFAAVYSACRP